MIINIKGHRIELYDNVQNLPILRFQKFNKYMMYANEIGNSLSDYDDRTRKALEFLQKEMIPEAMQELNNRRQLVFNAYNEFTPRGKAFAVLVRKIDGKRYDGISPDELDEVLEHLDRIGLGHADSLEALLKVKKNWRQSLSSIFQHIFRKTEGQTTQPYELNGSRQ